MSITGQRIKERRNQLEMSADEVAAQLGVSRSTIFRYENGHIEKVPANVLEKLAAILKTTPAYLMGWQDEYTENQRSHVDTPVWTHGCAYAGDVSLFREDDGKGYRADDSLRAAVKEAYPEDIDKITAIAKVYLALTDSGKRKAYDYVIDLSEQPKYQKQSTDAAAHGLGTENE